MGTSLTIDSFFQRRTSITALVTKLVNDNVGKSVKQNIVNKTIQYANQALLYGITILIKLSIIIGSLVFVLIALTI